MNSWPSPVRILGCRWCGKSGHAQMNCPRYLSWRIEYDTKYQESRKPVAAKRSAELQAGLIALYMFTVLSLVVLALRACGK